MEDSSKIRQPIAVARRIWVIVGCTGGFVILAIAVFMLLPFVMRHLILGDTDTRRLPSGHYATFLDSTMLSSQGMTITGSVYVDTKEGVASIDADVVRSDTAITVDLVIMSSRNFGGREIYPFRFTVDDIGDREVVLKFSMWDLNYFKVTEYLRNACQSAGIADHEVSEGNRTLVLSPDWPTIERQLVQMGARINPALANADAEDSDHTWLCEVTVVRPDVLGRFPHGAVWRASCSGGHMIVLEP